MSFVIITFRPGIRFSQAVGLFLLPNNFYEALLPSFYVTQVRLQSLCRPLSPIFDIRRILFPRRPQTLCLVWLMVNPALISFTLLTPSRMNQLIALARQFFFFFSSDLSSQQCEIVVLSSPSIFSYNFEGFTMIYLCCKSRLM